MKSIESANKMLSELHNDLQKIERWEDIHGTIDVLLDYLGGFARLEAVARLEEEVKFPPQTIAAPEETVGGVPVSELYKSLEEL